MKRKIAIFGATGYIGKSLSFELGKDVNNHLVLFGRDKEKIYNFVESIKEDIKASLEISTYDSNLDSDFNTIINCAGIGSPSEYKKNPSAIFDATEKIDNLILNYLEKNPRCKYINFSSGAAYGLSGTGIIDQSEKSFIDINNISPQSYYSISKINSEAKHRARSELNIVDLRVFSFFSHFVNTKDIFLMSELIGCVLNKKEFKTNNIDVIRDYIGPKDLVRLINIIIDKKESINDVFDITSLAPVSKFELIEFFEKKYSLKYLIGSGPIENMRDIRNVYYSRSEKLKELGFVPEFSSIACIEDEMKCLK